MHASIAAPMKPKPGFGRVVMITSITAAIAFSAGVALAQPSITALKGSGQQTTYAASFPSPLVVWVTNPATERPVAGLRVNFTAGAGVGLNATYAITDERGLASVSATGLVPCSSSVTAQIQGIPSARVSFDGLVVNKAILTIVPADVNAKVDGAIPAITDYTIHGFVNGDTEETAHIVGSPVLTTTATNHSPHANYAIKGGVGSLFSPNYAFVAGFGTLAIVGASNASDPQNGEQAALNASANDDAVVVRSALVNRPETMIVPQPAFVAGLRGASGVFVRDAIWPEPLATSAIARSSSARSALPNITTDAWKAPETSVRAVILPKSANASGMQALNTRSAMQVVVASAPKGTEVPVRAVVLPNLSSGGANEQRPLAGSTIRKAFNPPGLK
jgi:MBG domain (YGX type)